MADDPVQPVGGKTTVTTARPVTTPRTAPAPEPTAAPPAALGDGPSAVVNLSPPALEAAGDEGGQVADAAALPDDLRQLIEGLSRAVRKISHALTRLLHHLGRTEHEAEHAGRHLFDRIGHDLLRGRFDDHSEDRAVSRALRRFAHLAEKAGHFADKFLDRVTRDLAGPLAEGAQGSTALALSVSQSITVSVQSVEVLIQDGDSSVSVSYQSVSVDVTTTVGLVFAQSDPQVLDAEGNAVDTATLDSGLYFDARSESVAELVARLRQAGSGAAAAPQPDAAPAEAAPAENAEPDAAAADATEAPAPDQGGLPATLADNLLSLAQGQTDPAAGAALAALILVRQVSYSASLGITRVLFDAAAPVAQSGPAAPAAGDAGDAANLDLQI